MGAGEAAFKMLSNGKEWLPLLLPLCTDTFLSHVAERKLLLLLIHAALLGKQMFSFSSTHRELCFNTGGFTSEEDAIFDADTRWQSKSSLSVPPPTFPTMM